jgi:hypothetical protein
MIVCTLIVNSVTRLGEMFLIGQISPRKTQFRCQKIKYCDKELCWVKRYLCSRAHLLGDFLSKLGGFVSTTSGHTDRVSHPNSPESTSMYVNGSIPEKFLASSSLCSPALFETRFSVRSFSRKLSRETGTKLMFYQHQHLYQLFLYIHYELLIGLVRDRVRYRF